MKRLVALMMCAVSLYATAQIFDESDIFYQSDFSQNDFEGWSKSQTIQYDNRTLLGNFGNETCSLTLVCMPPHTGLQLSFDLYALDTWDGNGTSSGGNDPDLWFCSIDGGTLIETTFGHAINNPQSYPDNYPSNNPPFAGAVQQSLGYFCYGQNGTTAQYSLSFTIEHSVASAEIIFGADLLQDLCDESWALGNVVVSLNGSSAAMGCTDLLACNYNFEAACDDGSCDYSCCPGPGCCSQGLFWDWELGQCFPTNPADINLDGCVQLNDLLDVLSAYGDCGAEEFVEAEWTSCGDLVGYQGYNYETVLIGEDCWFVENVRYLPAVSAPSIGSEQDGLAHAYVYEWYGENGDVDAAMATTYYNDYGVLYNFQAVETWSLCPSGWHVPSSIEFRDLDVALGLPIGDFYDVGWSGAGAAIGTALKVEYGWCCGGGGTNTSGFSAKGAGGRWGDGQGPQFSDIGAASRWWTSTSSGENAWHHDVASQNAGVYWKDDAPKSRGHSVRCIKDTE